MSDPGAAHPAPAETPYAATDELLRRIRGEFLEMPGLRLTEVQDGCGRWTFRRARRYSAHWSRRNSCFARTTAPSSASSTACRSRPTCYRDPGASRRRNGTFVLDGPHRKNSSGCSIPSAPRRRMRRARSSSSRRLVSMYSDMTRSMSLFADAPLSAAAITGPAR